MKPNRPSRIDSLRTTAAVLSMALALTAGVAQAGPGGGGPQADGDRPCAGMKDGPKAHRELRDTLKKEGSDRDPGERRAMGKEMKGFCARGQDMSAEAREAMRDAHRDRCDISRNRSDSGPEERRAMGKEMKGFCARGQDMSAEEREAMRHGMQAMRDHDRGMNPEERSELREKLRDMDPAERRAWFERQG
ncbi:MAG: hypothetical protein ACLFRJ_02200 [Ectothiorhodospira sp.]